MKKYVVEMDCVKYTKATRIVEAEDEGFARELAEEMVIDEEDGDGAFKITGSHAEEYTEEDDE